MAGIIISREEARAQGLTRYFLGTPCKHGHISERIVSDARCSMCAAIALAKHKSANREKIRAQQNASRARPGPEREARLARRRERRKCPEARAKELEWVKRNRERVREAAARHYYKHHEKNLARSKRWREENPEKRAAYMEAAGNEKMRAYREAHREEFKAYYRQWQIDNPERIAASGHKRRARKKASNGTHTAADLRAILIVQGHRCAYCKADLKRKKRHLDHIMPLARGGSNSRANLQYLCEPCNLAKGAKDPIEYAQSLGLLL